MAQKRWARPGLQLGPYTTWRVGAVQHLPTAVVYLHEQLHLLADIPLKSWQCGKSPAAAVMCNWHSMQL